MLKELNTSRQTKLIQRKELFKEKIKRNRKRFWEQMENKQVNEYLVNKDKAKADSSKINSVHFEIQNNYLILGSSGLTGNLTLENLIQPWIYLETTNFLQNQIVYNSDIFDKVIDPENNKKELHIIQNFWCFNRKMVKCIIPTDVEDINEDWESLLIYDSKVFICRKEDIIIKPPEKKYGTLNTEGIEFCHNEFNFILSFKENCRDLNQEKVYMIGKPNNIVAFFKFNVFQLLIPQSNQWSKIFQNLFIGCSRLLTAVDGSTTTINIPPVSDISTMISTLGTNSIKAKRDGISRFYVDHDLNLNMAQLFAPNERNSDVKKRIVIVTSFNNIPLSFASPYFHCKLKVEQDLKLKVPGITELVILRPGPLIGNHCKPSHLSAPPDTTNKFLEPCIRMYYYKKNLLEFKHQFVTQCKEIGIKTRLSELIAQISYRKPGSWLIGYSLPVEKLAFITAINGLLPSSKSDQLQITIIKSEEIDKIL